MKIVALTAAAVLGLSAGSAFAQSLNGHAGGQTLFTPRGPVFAAGPSGGVQTAIMPGGATGIVSNNGNGTSTITTPNGQLTTVPSGF
jgi:hypothetical protein